MTGFTECLDRDDPLPDPLPARLEAQLADRHPATQEIGQWFTFAHLKGTARDVSRAYAAHFSALLTLLPDGPEFTAGARKLLESKDCEVRHTIATHPEDKREPTADD